MDIIGRESAIVLATAFVVERGNHITPCVEFVPWILGKRVLEFGGCCFVDRGRPHWAVRFISQLPPDVISQDPAGPMVFVDAETGEADFCVGP